MPIFRHIDEHAFRFLRRCNCPREVNEKEIWEESRKLISRRGGRKRRGKVRGKTVVLK